MRKNVAREIKAESNIVKLLLAKHRGIVRFELNVLESHKRQTMIYRQTRSAPSVFRYRLIGDTISVYWWSIRQTLTLPRGSSISSHRQSYLVIKKETKRFCCWWQQNTAFDLVTKSQHQMKAALWLEICPYGMNT